jgi:Tol biopolymer transport system component
LSLTPGTRLGVYEIIAPIGEGGMGQVFRARDTKLDRDVAIKILPPLFAHNPDRLARFEREARMLAALNHPHIGAIYGLEALDGTPALVLELVDGDTLAQRIAKNPLPVADALTVARQVAEALEAAHERGIVHRDLKPANIKVSAAGVVKVLDFGLAKAASGDAAGPDLTRSPTVTVGGTGEGVILGTAAYMSPEQARGRPVDKRTDIWAFGCVLYEMLTGHVAFRGETVSDTIVAILEREPKWDALPTATPVAVRRLLQRCLAKDPQRRLRDIGDARIDLDDGLTSGLQQAIGSTTSVRHTRRRERLAWAVAAVAGLALAALAVTTAMLVRRAALELLQTRFEINTPASDNPASLALSSDGRQVAYVARDADGMTRLWVRPLDQVTARPLAGTEGAFFPFWAPDGRALGFFAAGRLKRIDTADGAIQVLAEASGWGGTWSRAGVIVYAPLAGGPLWRIAASGGQPEAVTRMAPDVINHCWPQFLPDGRHFLFYLVAGPDQSGVYLGTLDGGEPTRVLTLDTSARYVAPGRLVYVRQGALVAMRFDATSGAVSGEPVVLAQGVGVGGALFRHAYDLSDTGVLTYRAGGGESRLQLMWVERSGATKGTFGPQDPYSGGSPEISPDGRRVAAERMVSGEHVWLYDVPRGVPNRLAFDTAIDAAPVWSPDGRRLVFASGPNGGNDLFERPASGLGDAQPLLLSPEPKWPLSWSPDGRFLLYASLNPKTGSDLWALPMSGDTHQPFPVVQTGGDQASGQFSPDGHWVAYVSNESGRTEVYAQTFPGPGGKWQLSTIGGTQPRWRADGKELFFVAPDLELMGVPIAAGTDGSLSAGTPVPLFRTRLFDEHGGTSVFARPQYAVAPDGRFLMTVTVEARTTPPITVVLNWQAALKR